MAVYIVLTITVVLLGCLIDNREAARLHTTPLSRENALKCGMTREKALSIGVAVVIFILLAGVSAMRKAVGNDYWVYRFQFNLIMQGRHVSYEPGFNLVVWVIQYLFGYDNYFPVFAFFSLITCAFFVKALYDQAEWFAASLFLLMTGGFYFSSLNSVRYYLVLAVALYSTKYVLRGEYGKFTLWILGASLFHKSVLFVIPVYLLARYLSGIKIKKWHIMAVGAVLLSLVFGQELYRRVIFLFYPYYEGSAFDTGGLSVTNIAKCLGVAALGLLFARSSLKENRNYRFWFILNLGGLVVYTCGSFIPEVSRVGYYLIVSQILLVPGLLQSMHKGKIRTVCIWGTATAFGLYFVLFLRQAYDVNVRLLPYYNWIFH